MKKKIFAIVNLMLLMAPFVPLTVVKAAAAPGSIVINEVAWDGSADSGSDEWIELYNPTGNSVDLTGWGIKDDGTLGYKLSGTVPAQSYFLIEKNEGAVSTATADLLMSNLSLANSGDTLEIVDENGAVVDIVNGSGGAWYAGNATSNATMERKDSSLGDVASNFATSTGSGAKASAGSAIVGTPKMVNSDGIGSTAGSGTSQTQKVELQTSTTTLKIGDVITVTAQAQTVQELFAYGFTIGYDPQILQFQSAVQGAFLSESGAVQTSFHSALQEGVSGKLLVAEARTADTKVGKTGSGNLFTLTFQVKAAVNGGSTLLFSPDSFISSPQGDMNARFVPLTVNPISNAAAVEPVTNMTANSAIARYAIRLEWLGPIAGADKYRIERKDAQGKWNLLGETTTLQFIDQDAVTHGGKIIPGVAYSYRVTAAKGSNSSVPVMMLGVDARGLKGDNNRTDLVDGRDLERLAQHFGQTSAAAGFDALIDTNFDGVINGSDLIDIGAGFAHQYK